MKIIDHKILDIEELCEGGASTREDGRDILVLILKWWKRSKKISLDFKNIEFVCITFADEVFGTLAMHFSNEELKEKLDLINIDEINKRVINATISSRRKELEELETIE